MSLRWGKFTARGGPGVEDTITEIVEQVAERIARGFADSPYRALVMLGGYGRGEGGAEIVAGIERPHNNLDFLLLSELRGDKKLERLNERLRRTIAPIATSSGIGIDISAVSAPLLRRAPSLVMWYDMRFGHKTIIGDTRFVPGLTRFRADRIPGLDVLRLMANRGALLVINDFLLSQPDLPASHRRTIIKHIMKAIIGYGDACLFRYGRYHWSYLEKQRRFRKLATVPRATRALYEEAMEFRFRPDYTKYLTLDLGSWMEEIRSALEPLHLDFERFRLKTPDLSWSRYAGQALRADLLTARESTRDLARKIVEMPRPKGRLRGFGPMEILGYRCSRESDLLSYVSPVLIFRLSEPTMLRLALAVLQPRGNGDGRAQTLLRNRYLRKWGLRGDINFSGLADRIGLHEAA